MKHTSVRAVDALGSRAERSAVKALSSSCCSSASVDVSTADTVTATITTTGTEHVCSTSNQ
eukprot:15753-Heterococcus_DN1.PRE.2